MLNEEDIYNNVNGTGKSFVEILDTITEVWKMQVQDRKEAANMIKVFGGLLE